MPDSELRDYCERAMQRGATRAIEIPASSIVTAPWVRLKCQFGCTSFDRSYACPPASPTPEQTRAVVDSYQRAILFHFAVPKLEPDTSATYREYYRGLHNMVVDLEGEAFKDGYYKALAYLFGGCMLCPECSKLKQEPCRLRARLRPGMEGSGMDVFQTVRNNGLAINTLRVRGETRNQFCLLLMD